MSSSFFYLFYVSGEYRCEEQDGWVSVIDKKKLRKTCKRTVFYDSRSDSEKSGCILYTKISTDIYILMVQQKASMYWGFPKGSRMPHESDEEAAQRELLEETSIRIPINSDQPFMKTNKNVFYLIYVKYKLECYIDKTELMNYQWYKLKNALKLYSSKTTKNALHKLLQTFNL